MSHRKRARTGAVTLAVALVLAVAPAFGCSSTADRPATMGTRDTADAANSADVADVAGPATTADAPSGGDELLAAVCDGRAALSDAGTVRSSELSELSGIAASRRNPGVWWVHNDSGDSARFFAISGSADLLATIDVDDAAATDWEDIAVGPPASDTGGGTLYLGDIGDNGRARPNVTVYRAAEPAVDTGTAGVTAHVSADPLTLTYPDGAHDAEALLVDPITGDLVIVTKDWTLAGHSQVFRAPAGLPAGSTTVLEAEATLDLRVGTLVTGADVSPDGSVVALRSYGGISLYPRPAGEPLWAAFTEQPCSGPPPLEKQGEAIAFSADGASYATISEGEDPTLHLTSP